MNSFIYTFTTLISTFMMHAVRSPFANHVALVNSLRSNDLFRIAITPNVMQFIRQR